MKGSSNGKPNEQGGADSFANDWRTQHEPNQRERVIFALVRKLKMCVPTLSEDLMKKTAIKSEDKIYGLAKDMDDYLRKINRKFVYWDRKFRTVSSADGAHTTPDPSSNSGDDWREETYQKIQALKEKYVHVLNTMFQCVCDNLREIDSLPPEKRVSPEWLKGSKVNLKMALVFLNVSKSSVSEFHRDRFSGYEGKILRFAVCHQTLTERARQRKQQPQTETESQEHLVTLPPETITEWPIDRLIKAIQSSSPESLAESVSEMRSVISTSDMLPGSIHTIGGSRARLGEDLSESTTYRLQQGDTNPIKRFKRLLTTMPLDSTASRVNNIEPGCALLQEIIEINGRLVETVVSICNDDVCPSEVISGTVVKCSYVPVALSDTFKALYKSRHISQIQPLRLLVPESYPCSPIILDKTLFDTASEYKYEDLSARTRSRFGLSMEAYSEPMSLKKIAQVWDECARATMAEYAERHGGGTFSSKYGRWESLLRVS